MPYSKLHAAARNYAVNGWPVFPIIPNAKEPAVKGGYMRATTDLKQIDEWWAIDDFNIGFCPENAGLCVVDEDTDKGGKYNEPTANAQVKSPRGKHFYYAGSLPPTANRIGPFIDTRGRGSYVLLPPSIANGNEYIIPEGNRFPLADYELPEVPQWVAERCSSTAARPRDRSETIKTEVTDRPQAIALFKRYLERNPIPPEGEGSDDAVYRMVCRGFDLGLSDGTITSYISDATAFDLDWIIGKLENVERYQQNEPGCDTPETGQEKWGKLVAQGSEQGSTEAQDQSWVPHDPRDPADMPKLTYFDGEAC